LAERIGAVEVSEAQGILAQLIEPGAIISAIVSVVEAGGHFKIKRLYSDNDNMGLFGGGAIPPVATCQQKKEYNGESVQRTLNALSHTF